MEEKDFVLASHNIYGRPKMFTEANGFSLEFLAAVLGYAVRNKDGRHYIRGEEVSDLASFLYEKTGDERVQFFTSRELADPPSVPAETTLPLVEQYLKDSRIYRHRNEIMNTLSKRMQNPLGSTFYKFPPVDGKVLHIGSGSYGSASMRHSKCDRVDPLYNHQTYQDLTRKSLRSYDTIVSDVAVSGDGLGLGRNRGLLDFLVRQSRSKRVVAKLHLADALEAGFPIIMKPRPHNMEVICDSSAEGGLSAQEVLDGIIKSNEERNFVHKGHMNAISIASGCTGPFVDPGVAMALMRPGVYEEATPVFPSNLDFVSRRKPHTFEPEVFDQLIQVVHPFGNQVAMDVYVYVKDMQAQDRLLFLRGGSHGLTEREAAMVEWSCRYNFDLGI